MGPDKAVNLLSVVKLSSVVKLRGFTVFGAMLLFVTELLELDLLLKCTHAYTCTIENAYSIIYECQLGHTLALWWTSCNYTTWPTCKPIDTILLSY